MKTPTFWSSTVAPLALLLWPVGKIYGWITAWRMHRGGETAALLVICIGNLTAGGTGKTPTVQMLARELRARGETPFIVSRGYGGRLEGPVRVDPRIMSASDCGDEPLLLARETPVIVARNRVAGASLAKELGASLVLLDDGLQNPRLAKDLTVAVVDAEVGFGNGYCLPAGPLRAPIASQLPKIDAFLAIGSQLEQPLPPSLQSLGKQDGGKPFFRGMLQPDAAILANLTSKPLLAFAGIGRPQRFFATLKQAKLDLRATRAFADHHPFTPADLKALQAQAAADGLQLVTTEKDFERLPQEYRHSIVALPVALTLADDGLIAMVTEAIARKRSEP